jgi:plastocyanin
MTRRRLLQDAGLTMLSLGVLPVLQGCGNGSARESANGDAMIEMNDHMLFVPSSLVVRVGQTVTWRNVGAMVHTSTCDPASAQRPEHAVLPDGAERWDSGLVRTGESWSHSFDIPGEYTYFCTPHEAGGMIGSLTVEE